MSQPIDLSQFPDLPAEVIKAFAAMEFELLVERATSQHKQAVVAEKDAFIPELKDLIEKLVGKVHNYRRTKELRRPSCFCNQVIFTCLGCFPILSLTKGT